MEWLAARFGVTLFPVHRLDRETTGVMIFARSKESAEKARALFEGRQVKKDYFFLTDHPSKSASFTVDSNIERVGNLYVSSKVAEPNARTVFELVKTEGRFSLWLARPETGKPHQIRLHAQDAGIPLLGDQLHGGTEFPALCLHAFSLTIDGQTHQSPPPEYFNDLRLLSDRRLIRWLAACDRRERALRNKFDSQVTNTVRWIHTEGDPLRVEQLGDVVSLNWFRETYPNDDEWSSIQKLLQLKSWRTWYLQIRADRGKDPHADRSLASESEPPERWVALENGLKFEFRRETGLSPGLFLDQRRNRSWIKDNSEGKRVLNLFCYTAGFSVAAAAGGAEQVVSVDVSKPFLEWAKENFQLNGLDLAPHEFRAIDSGEFLAWAIKKNLAFDTVICDPPSFARTNTRGKSSVFRIEAEFESLLTMCLKVTKPKGQVLFSTNFEQWSLDDVAAKAQGVLKALKIQGATLISTPSPDVDFELPRAPRHMKSIVVKL
jgi:23S rRNA (cytosine1962-C5)-methyltransferase